MKASEEISADLFIKNCLQSQGMHHHRQIVNLAREEKGSDFAANVDELIREGESKAYTGKIQSPHCDGHDVDMMYDEHNEEHYCPICL
jgi:hypothetical protein